MKDLPEQYLRGIGLFNEGKYFECHEALEEIWLRAEGEERDFLHALIQTAVALHHFRRDNLRGAESVSRRAIAKLKESPAKIMSIDSAGFAENVESFFDEAFHSPDKSPLPPTIKIEE